MISDHLEFDDHESVVFCHDGQSGLKAIIAIHDTSAGPAMGGCRMAPYPSEIEALTDVLRLSRGMSFKNIMADLPHGGAKAVIMADATREKSPGLITAFARYVERLNGAFITGEDVGISVADVQQMRAITSHVRGIPENGAGDPSPMTALGVFEGIKAAVHHLHDTSDLADARVLIQGLGAVGMRLATLLREAGAKLLVTDVDATKLQEAKSRFDAEIVAPDAWYVADMDIYAPCAFGATLNEKSIFTLTAKIVAGAANNQLATPKDGQRLSERGILYAPDYVINAGGVISTALEGPNFDSVELHERVASISDTLRAVFTEAEVTQSSTSAVADVMARARLAKARLVKAQRDDVALKVATEQ